MSKLAEIRQNALQVSDQAKKVAGSLRSYRTKFDQLISQIDANLSETATGEDERTIGYLREVKKCIDDAVLSLERAGSETRQWANRL